MRARMAVKISNQEVELREVLLREKPQSMIDISSKGTVPVLQLAPNQVIDESLDVIKWALSLNDPFNWKRSSDAEKSKEFMEMNDGDFKHHLDRYKYSKRYENEDPEHHKEKCLSFINEIEKELNNSRFLYDNNISSLDISILPFVRQFRAADMQWFDSLDKPNIKMWLNNFLESDLFKSIMMKYPQWKEGDEKIIFP
jgi:glutathione S-transferase